MSGWTIVLMAVLNIVTGVDQARSGNWPMAVVFLSYGVACGGLYFASK